MLLASDPNGKEELLTGSMCYWDGTFGSPLACGANIERLTAVYGAWFRGQLTLPISCQMAPPANFSSLYEYSSKYMGLETSSRKQAGTFGGGGGGSYKLDVGSWDSHTKRMHDTGSMLYDAAIDFFSSLQLAAN
ncbi:uncharacterized protein TERG_01801 [Trichophyton rubrum CBS 118892]|uniref:Uncharacterized protein n=1 Tax=Trichophyton rubrum (strain ATCC MYA-4607 / CBS 118892) TaxID=559305 RepID=F2SI26_TRIRC|nr:uncharacterized protein TERG_01801 [Trichophyton rubrum CBS 118892]EGD85530.1 hypothetical protein TERG_01801 [Trichophyton rubrum CBS 118892]